MKRLVLLGLGISALAACGDNNKPGSAIDAPPVDMATDMATDAAVATHSGTIALFSVRLKNMGGPGVDGNGPQISISFSDNSMFPAPLMQESTSLTDGCKLWEFTAAQVVSTAVAVDEGPVQVTATDGAPVFPACIFAGPAAGYVCPATLTPNNFSANVSQLAGAAGTTTITATTAAFSAADIGRYIKFAGTGTTLDGFTLPIIMAPSTSIIVVAGQAVTAVDLNVGNYQIFAGVGPIPGATPTSFIGNDEQVTFAHAESAHYEAFTGIGFTGASGVGDDFTLGTANGKVLPTTIPTNGTAFTVGCDNDAACPNALGTILNIVTTDTAATASNPFPLPTTKRVQVRCIKIGQTTITVPAEYSAHLMAGMSGAKRIQTTFIRSNQAGFQNAGAIPNSINIAGGHAEVGFITVP